MEIMCKKLNVTDVLILTKGLLIQQLGSNKMILTTFSKRNGGADWLERGFVHHLSSPSPSYSKRFTWQ